MSKSLGLSNTNRIWCVTRKGLSTLATQGDTRIFAPQFHEQRSVHFQALPECLLYVYTGNYHIPRINRKPGNEVRSNKSKEVGYF